MTFGAAARICTTSSGEPPEPWNDEPRESRIVFIGRDLKKERLERVYPFGMAVSLTPPATSTRFEDMREFDPKMLPRVFLGYAQLRALHVLDWELWLRDHEAVLIHITRDVVPYPDRFPSSQFPM